MAQTLALSSGRRSGLYVALGVAIGAFFWSLITVYGLAKMFEIYPHLIRAFAIVGGGYLAYIGARAVWNAVYRPHTRQDFERITVKHALLHGLTVTATNPKAAMFWLSLSTLVSSLSGSATVMLVFASVVSILAFVVYGGYAVMFSVDKFRSWYAIKQQLFTFVFGGYFLTVGTCLILLLGV